MRHAIRMELLCGTQFVWNSCAARNSDGIIAVARNLHTVALTIRVIGCVRCNLRRDTGSRMVVWADWGRKQNPAKRVRRPRLRAGRPVRSGEVRRGTSTLAHVPPVAPVSAVRLPGARLERLPTGDRSFQSIPKAGLHGIPASRFRRWQWRRRWSSDGAATATARVCDGQSAVRRTAAFRQLCWQP